MSAPVLLTRPGARGQVLAEAVAAFGLSTLRLEVMRQETVPETADARSAWLDIDHFHKVIVISPAAAEQLVEALDRYWPQLPQGLELYAVGQATAELLYQALGVRVRLPTAAAGEETSEALLALPSLKRLDQQRVLLVAGEGGRSLLGETLAQRGARLTRVEVYRRRLLPLAEDAAQRLAAGDYGALVVSSGEILEHLARWCSEAAFQRPLVVSSQRLATLAKTLGFRVPVVASGASPAALAAAVARTCDPEDGE
ncbi:uroporphyrinogen-III synthase [Halomonas cupida]|uniref:uroporphyrinogen-III synthase n=1 Tax=Halomonas cupida TaxID=44933 RepID=UPI002E9D481D|nr:uroporphyrinogen-III synthase [Pseudomonadota bacterium]